MSVSSDKAISVTRSAEQTERQDADSLAHSLVLSGARQHPPAPPPGYQIQHCLGGGAFGSVWLAVESNTGKQVAIKFYTHRRGVDWSLLNREVEKLAELYTCRDIIGLIKVGWEADPPYYVMEYLENGSLAQLLQQGALPVSEAVRIVTTVTHAVIHAHRSGILHCDLKPANILLDRDFAPRLADFGQSRLSHEQDPALGTLFYMAPEQADLQAVPDPRWDVYALGALMYHALCGEAPHRTPEHERRIQAAHTLEDRLAVYREIIRHGTKPKKLRQLRSVDQRLADIVERCLEVDPALRFPTAEAVGQALESRARHRSRRPLVALGVLAPMLLLAAIGPFALRAMNNAVQTAETNLAERALESDAVTAKILPSAVQNSLDQRSLKLVEVARNRELQEAILQANIPGSNAVTRLHRDELLKGFREQANAELRDQRTPLDDSWFLTNAVGIQVWRDPPSARTHERNFRWRSYFHGQGIDYKEETAPANLQPIRKPHVSPAYRSQAVDSYRVAISAPVWDAEHKEVIGVIGRSIPLGLLLDEYQQVLRANLTEAVDRTIALVDVRTGEMIDHPWLTSEHLKLLPELEYDKLTLPRVQRQRLQVLQDLVTQRKPVAGVDRDPQYSDPIGFVGTATAQERYGMTWLAAFWPVLGTNWVAVVQERRDEALKPVREMRSGILRYYLGGLALCCVLMGGLWFFVLRALTTRPHRLKAGAFGTQGQPPSTVISADSASPSR